MYILQKHKKVLPTCEKKGPSQKCLSYDTEMILKKDCLSFYQESTKIKKYCRREHNVVINYLTEISIKIRNGWREEL